MVKACAHFALILLARESSEKNRLATLSSVAIRKMPLTLFRFSAKSVKRAYLKFEITIQNISKCIVKRKKRLYNNRSENRETTKRMEGNSMYGFERIDFMGNIITDDSELGYEVEEENAEVKKNREEVEKESKPAIFYKTYVDSILNEVRNLTGNELKFMVIVSAMMTWNSRIIITKAVKDKLMYHLALTNEGTLRNLLTSLSKKGFLKRVDIRTYVVNDFFFTKQAEPNVKAKRKWVDSLKQSTQNDDDII